MFIPFVLAYFIPPSHVSNQRGLDSVEFRLDPVLHREA